MCEKPLVGESWAGCWFCSVAQPGVSPVPTPHMLLGRYSLLPPPPPAPPSPPGLGRQLTFPMDLEDLDSRPFSGCPWQRGRGAAAGVGTMLLVLCWHLPAAVGCFRAAVTAKAAEGPTRVPVGLCWRRQLASQKSIPPQIPSSRLVPAAAGNGAAGSILGPAGLSRLSLRPCGAGASRGHHRHLPLRRDPAGHKAPHCCDSSWAWSDGDTWVVPSWWGAWLMEKPTVKHPCPVHPHALVSWGSPHPTPSHPGALGSLPSAVPVPGAGRALGSRTSCRQRKEELDDNGGGGEPGCRLMNNATASLSGAADFLFTDTPARAWGGSGAGAQTPGVPQPRAPPSRSPPLNIPLPRTRCPQPPRGHRGASPGAGGLHLTTGPRFRVGEAGTPASALLHGSLSIPLQQWRWQPEGFLTWAFPWQRSKMAPGSRGLLGTVARQRRGMAGKG